MKPKTDGVAGRRLLLASAYGLTSRLLDTGEHAGKRESGKVVYYTAGKKIQSASSLLGGRHKSASDGDTRSSLRVMLPSPVETFMTTPDFDALFQGDAQKLPTKDPSEETAR